MQDATTKYCFRCGHDLTVEASGPCPECGLIFDAFNSDTWRRTPPDEAPELNKIERFLWIGTLVFGIFGWALLMPWAINEDVGFVMRQWQNLFLFVWLFLMCNLTLDSIHCHRPSFAQGVVLRMFFGGIIALLLSISVIIGQSILNNNNNNGFFFLLFCPVPLGISAGFIYDAFWARMRGHS